MKRHIWKAALVLCLGATHVMQGVWLADAAKKSEDVLRRQLAEILEKAVEKETMMRLEDTPKGTHIKRRTGYAEVAPFVHLSEALAEMGYRPSVHRLDSIADSLLAVHGIRANCQTSLYHETKVAEQSSEDETFVSDTIGARYPVYADHSYTAGIALHNPNRIIYSRLGFLLAATFGLTFIALAGLLYYIRHTLHERRVNRLKDDFMVATSHDMRNPLATLKICAEALREDTIRHDGEKSAHYLSLVDATLDTLQSQVERNILIYRMKDGPYPLVRERVPIAAAVDKTMGRQAGRKKMELRTQYEVEELWAQPDLVEHLLANLLSNSLKYSDNEVRITIRTESRGEYDILRFKDNGRGIPKKYHKAIFRKYHRGIHTEKPSPVTPRGYGMGLNFVYSIMKRHGGRVTVQSEAGKGAEFLLYFPKRKE